MKKLLWAECRKLRHSKMISIMEFSTVMVAVIVFAQGQFTFYGSSFISEAGWYLKALQSLATFYVLPAVIALFGSYLICREEQEDVLKSLQIIPVDQVQIIVAKLLIVLFFSAIIYMSLFLIGFLMEAVLHFKDLSVEMVLHLLKMYVLDGICVSLAISPIIAFVALIKKGYWIALIFTELASFAGLFMNSSDLLRTCYPITAVFTVSGYYESTLGNILKSLLVLLGCGVLSILILKRLRAGKEGGNVIRQGETNKLV